MVDFAGIGGYREDDGLWLEQPGVAFAPKAEYRA